MTNRFGTSSFTQGDNGELTSAGYTLDPQLRGMQDRLFGQANYGLDYMGQTNNQAQQLFGLGGQYMATNPQQAAQDWMTKQQNLLAPSRDRQLASVRNGLFNTGRGGLSVGATGARPDGSAGLGASNPEMEAYFNAIAQQDAGLATQAMDQGMNQVKFGAGLFGTGQQLQANALQPYNNAMVGVQNLENLGKDAYTQALELARLQSSVNGGAAGAWQSGMNNASQLQMRADSWDPWGAALQGIGRDLAGMSFGSNPMSSLQASFSQTGLGQSGFGTGLAYGNQDYGMYF
jgi:hypothetical protein